MAQSRRWVYFFGNGKADGKGDQKELLGGKGAGLAEMTRIGLPVPGGFTITTEACDEFNQRGKKWPPGLDQQVRQNLARLERACKKKFGAAKDPLLVSVRSGAARSMPGMMETILNLGLNNRSVEGLADAASDRRFALDAYRRLIMMYGATARHISRERFDEAFDEVKRTRTAPRLGQSGTDKVVDTDVNEDELAWLVERFKAIYREHVGEEFPQDPIAQLQGAIDAVFDSWMAEKAVTYRRVEKITGLKGTAVNVCQMVFGNMGERSGTGVCFTRDPSSGEPILYGEFLLNAQGEDVVAGVRTPLRIEDLQEQMPDLYDQLEAVRVNLELHYKDMQDIEFTFERGRLYLLQCRTGKRSPQAAFKIAVDQATKGMISSAAARNLLKKKYLPKRLAVAATKPFLAPGEAIHRITAADIERLFYPVLDPDVAAAELAGRHLGSGIGAVPGAAAGEVVFTAAEAEERAEQGASVILVRRETSPEDVGGMHAAAGILTATGGKTSHAAVVARGWGKCCIVGCDSLSVNYRDRSLSINGRTLRAGESITLDGTTGRIYAGQVKLVLPQAPPEYETFMRWCDERRRMKVRANADTPEDAAKAVQLGAEGIGLCRTEHMFFEASEPARLVAMRRMILADSPDGRRAALDRLLPFQRRDFEGIFEAMNGLPVTVRLLDPPLHEFLPGPDNPDGLRAVADEINGSLREEMGPVSVWDTDRNWSLDGRRVSPDDIARRVEQLHEANPMLGHRGCRLCVTYPEILEMQVRAIVEAAVNCAERGVQVLPEIMIPLSIDEKELALLVGQTRAAAELVLKERNAKLNYLVGTMVETPRACLRAAGMAESAEFFSFGTNDLTQMTLGISRDDAGRFLPAYVDADKAAILPDDPFQSLDLEGVGVLMRMAVEQGRHARPKIKLGICGEHGGDPKSIAFCEELGLDYVSCSPLRVPIARLAAAQAAMARSGGGSGRTRRKPNAKKTGGKKAKRTSSGRSGRRPAAKGKRSSAKPAVKVTRSKSARKRKSARGDLVLV